MKTRDIALYGLLITFGLIMSYVEAQIPAFFAVPGMKLGLANVAVLLSLYLIGHKAALLINLLRVVIAGLLFGSGISLAFSTAGAICSWCGMVLLKKGGFRTVTVSIVGGLLHNVGQILVAMIVLSTSQVVWYFVALWLSGMASGAVIGVLGGLLVKRLGPVIRRFEQGASI